MGSVPALLGCFDVPKRKTIQSRQTRNMRANSCDGEEDSPCNEPDGEEDYGQHAKETNEEVGV